MTIINQPDSLSLSGNLNKFIIGNSEPIKFSLYKGSELIFKSNYTPGHDNQIVIDINRIVISTLSFELKDIDTPYIQSNIKATFRAVIDNSAETSFTVIRTGISNLADTPTRFLSSNFLTWQPQVKDITPFTPESLTYYALSDSVVKCKAYTLSSPNETIEHSTLTLSQLSAGNVYTIPLHYQIIKSDLPDKAVMAYDIWIEDLQGQRLTYIQRYQLSDILSEQEDWILFENSLGGIDTFRAYGDTDFKSDNTHNISINDGVLSEYRVDMQKKYDKSTGYLDILQRQWLIDFFLSGAKYIYSGSRICKIIVTESNVEYSSKELPSEFTFVYRFAEDKPYLNISRLDSLPSDISIVSPDMQSFPLPPRLNEFPRQTLSEGVLFPVQHPYSESWGTTTFGALLQSIISNIEDAASSEGSAAFHIHENQDLLSALSWLNNYLLVAGKKINAGSADILSPNSPDWNRIVRTDVDSVVNAVITFLNNINISGKLKSTLVEVSQKLSATLIESVNLNVSDTITAFLAQIQTLSSSEISSINAAISNLLSFKNATVSGDISSLNYADALMGWFIKQDGTAQLKGLKLLEFLDVPELRYNRVTVLAGESWRGPGAGLIESVDTENQIIYLKLLDGDKRTVDIDDICKGIFHHNNGFQTVFFRPTEMVGKTAFKYSLRPGTTLHPSAMMNFISYGNFTNKDRQKSVQETTSYKRYLANVNTWDISPSMIMMQLGDLSGLQINGVAMDGYSAYLNRIFMTGTIRQISSSGTEVNVAIIMGEWQSGSYGYYEQVTYNGSSWLCVNEKGTTTIPESNSADWLEISAKGKDAISVSVESSNGNIMLYGQWSTVLTCTVRSGDNDITESIPQSRISWERTSADPSGDLAFNITHQGIGKQLEITKDDIFRKAKFDVVVNL